MFWTQSLFQGDKLTFQLSTESPRIQVPETYLSLDDVDADGAPSKRRSYYGEILLTFRIILGKTRHP